MITTGTKIELIKPMGVLGKIGEICEIKEVLADGTICFRCSVGLGYMSYDEFTKYFKLYKIKNSWSEWHKISMKYLDLDGIAHFIPIKYRYNSRRVDLRTDREKDNLKVRTSCYKDDSFVLKDGVRLACARLKIKLMQEEVDKMAKSM